MDELTCQPGTLTQSSKIGGMIISPVRLTPVQWLICVIAAIGFAFDLYEAVVLPVVLRPALAALGNLKPGNPDFNPWVGLLFYVPAAVGGAFGLLGGYLTDLFGRRRVLVWSILLYAFSAFAASHATTLLQFLIFRCTTMVGVCVEYVAAVAWLAELFSNPKQRESVLGYTQSAVGLGGLMATGGYYLAVTYAECLPTIRMDHEAWRYVLLFGLLPAIPLILVRPFLPESPVWRDKKAKGTLKQPSIAELFRPALRKTTLVTTLIVACTYAMGGVQFVAELGTLAGRLLFAVLVARIATQRLFLRIFLVPGLLAFSWVYFFAATHSLVLLKYGIFVAAVLMNGPFSLLWNYLPRVYPTHLRGTGESFATNIGGRVFGTSAAVLTTQLTNVMPGAGASARLAYSAATVAVLAYSTSLLASFWLREPESGQLPD